MSGLQPPDTQFGRNRRRDPAGAAVRHRARELDADQQLASLWLNGKARAQGLLRRLVGRR